MKSNYVRDMQSGIDLPPCEGPKLSRYKNHQCPIQFVRLLSQPQNPSDSSGGHGHVFEVRIKDSRFALKIFKFYQASYFRAHMAEHWTRNLSDDTLVYHTDPFYAECRAYGAIQESQTKLQKKRARKGSKQSRAKNSATHEIAVPCYGYLSLSTEMYMGVLQSQFGLTDWNLDNVGNHRGHSPPFRALVKQLVDSNEAIVNPPKMLRDLKSLRSIGVNPRDIFVRNYKNGLLVDFSSSFTNPHWMFWTLKKRQLELKRDSELVLFDMMMKEEGITTTVRAAPNAMYCRKLRSGIPIEDYYASD